MRLARGFVSALVAGAALSGGPGEAHAQDGATGVDVSARAGIGFTATTARFTWDVEDETFNATVLWGDGTNRTPATVVRTGGPDSSGIFTFEVRASHTYGAVGTFPISTNIVRPGHAPVIVSSTATVTAAPVPLAAKLAIVPAAAGRLVSLDASASTGPATGFQFDLDGNGSYETKCGSPKASAVYSRSGPRTVGVKVVTPTGSSSVSRVGLTVGAGTTPELAPDLAGGCTDKLPGDTAQATDKLLVCPRTLLIGMAELVIPESSPTACFARDEVGEVAIWRAPDAQVVHANGLEIQPWGAKISIGATQLAPSVAIVRTFEGGTGGGRARVVLEGRRTEIRSKPAELYWAMVKPSSKPNLPKLPDKPILVQTLVIDEGKLYGMEVAPGPTGLTLTPGAGADLRVRMQVPEPFSRLAKIAGGSITSAPVLLRADNTAALVTSPLSLSFADLPAFLFTIRNITVSHAQQGSSDIWTGSFELEFPGGVVERLKGSLGMVDGTPSFASAAADLNPGIGPIGCCVFLTHIDAGFADLSFSGGADFSAGPSVFGRTLASLETDVTAYYETQPVTVKFAGRSETVDAFLLAKGGLNVLGYDLGVNAEAALGPGGFVFGGGIHEDWGPFSFDGGAVLRLDVGGSWWGKGRGDVCAKVIGCTDGRVAVGPKGLSACARISIDYLPDPAAGGWIRWSDNSVGFFLGCSWGKIEGKAGIARAAQAGAVRVPGGLRHVLLAIRGRGGAPRLTVVSPAGRRIETTGPATTGTDRRTHLWRLDEASDTTYVVIARPQAGRWRVSGLPGSAPLAEVARAAAAPVRPVTASVSGRGERRLLRYRVAGVSGQRVLFAEAGRFGVRSLGAARGRTGTLRFTPAAGRGGRRSIVARVERDGLPFDEQVVARFQVPDRRLAAPRVRARRAGARLVASWGRVPGARRYMVEAVIGDGRRLLRRVRGRRLVLRAFLPRSSARVRVAAVDAAGRAGRAGRDAVRAMPAVRLRRAAGRVAVLCAATAEGTCEVRLAVGGRRLALAARPVAPARIARVPISTRRLRGRAGTLTVQLPGEPERRSRLGSGR